VTFIAVLEADESACDAMLEALEEVGLAQRAEIFGTATEMVAWLDENLHRTSLICLDDAPESGRIVTRWLAGRPAECPVLVHGGAEQQQALAAAGWETEHVPIAAERDWVRHAWIHSVHEIVGLGA
jgi:NADPH-dependent ferric siderophore reductase